MLSLIEFFIFYSWFFANYFGVYEDSYFFQATIDYLKARKQVSKWNGIKFSLSPCHRNRKEKKIASVKPDRILYPLQLKLIFCQLFWRLWGFIFFPKMTIDCLKAKKQVSKWNGIKFFLFPCHRNRKEKKRKEQVLSLVEFFIFYSSFLFEIDFLPTILVSTRIRIFSKNDYRLS